MRAKVKNKSHRYDINRTKPRLGYEYTKYKMCLIRVMIICHNQHLTNI